jgi:hypothetical protein
MVRYNKFQLKFFDKNCLPKNLPLEHAAFLQRLLCVASVIFTNYTRSFSSAGARILIWGYELIMSELFRNRFRNWLASILTGVACSNSTRNVYYMTRALKKNMQPSSGCGVGSMLISGLEELRKVFGISTYNYMRYCIFMASIQFFFLNLKLDVRPGL